MQLTFFVMDVDDINAETDDENDTDYELPQYVFTYAEDMTMPQQIIYQKVIMKLLMLKKCVVDDSFWTELMNYVILTIRRNMLNNGQRGFLKRKTTF